MDADALVTTGTMDAATVFVRLPSAFMDLESAASAEDELRYILQRGAEVAPPDSRWHVVIDGPALVGVIELQGTVFGGKRLERPTEEQRGAVVAAVTRELTRLGYDVNPETRRAMTGEEADAYFDDFLGRVMR